MVTRRRVLWGALGSTVFGGSVLLNQRFGWLSLPGADFTPTAREMVRTGGAYQTSEGDIRGDYYLTCQFAAAAVCAGFRPQLVRVSKDSRSVFDYFASDVKVNDYSSREVTDSISRLQISRILGLDTDFRRSEAEVLIQKRLTSDERGFGSLNEPGASLAYLPFGAVALKMAGASRNSPIFSRIEALLAKIRVADGGYPERPDTVSVADMSSAVLMAQMAPRDGKTEEFLHGLQTTFGGFAFNGEDLLGQRENIASTALVHRARPGVYGIPELLAGKWMRGGQLDDLTEGDSAKLYNLFMAAQVLGRPGTAA